MNQSGSPEKTPVSFDYGPPSELPSDISSNNIEFGIYNSHSGRDTSRLETFRPYLESSAVDTIRLVLADLPIKDVGIGVFDLPEKTIPEYGIGGLAHKDERGTRLIQIAIDPASPKIKSALNEDFKRTLRHELNHISRFQNQGDPQTLLDFIISEGIATAYEIQDPTLNPSLYATALKIEQIPEYLERLKKDFMSTDLDIRCEWLFGSKEKGIPRWAGYSIGFHLIQQYLKLHPDQKPSTLSLLRSELFIR